METLRKNAKDAIDDLIDYRIDMLKKDVDNEKDAIDKKLKYLKDFYDKQKEMLQDVADEEEYLNDQQEKRKSVTDIQAELAQLQYDDSAWAQKRKLELNQELSDAQKELDDFEKDHALELALDAIDDAYNSQETQLNAEMEALEEKLNDPNALFNQALNDIKNNSKNQLYYQMLMYNRQYGDGKDETVKEMWEKAYGALDEYQKMFGSAYNGITLKNETGYQATKTSTSTKTTTTQSAKTTTATTTSKQTTSSPALTNAIKRKVAAAIWNGNYGWGTGSDRSKRLTEVFGANNGIQALVNRGVGKMDGAPGNDYTYLNMRKKFKGYASGTCNATAGWHAIDELGDEYVFTSADGTRYKMLNSGDHVLNAEATDFLYDFANGGQEILEKIIKSAVGGLFDKIVPIINNNDIDMGGITVNGNADAHTVSEIRRAQRDNLKTMLQELQKLNK